MKIVSVGSATIDLYFKSKALPETKNDKRLSLAYGGKYLADEFAQSIGGGGCNAAVSLARQGYEVFFWGKVSHDWWGKLILKKLKSEKVKTNLVQKAEQTTVSTILLGKEGERTIITFRAQNDNLNFTSSVKKTLNSAQWFYLANLPLCPKKERIKWLRFAKNNGVKTFVNLSGGEFKKGEKYLQDFIQLSDIFALNAYELADIWGQEPSELNLFKTNFAQKLRASVLIVTYDIHGSFLYTQKRIYYQPIFKVKVVDTTGAGDAYASGFLGKFIETHDFQKSMAFAAKNAASVIAHLTTQKGLLYG